MRLGILYLLSFFVTLVITPTIISFTKKFELFEKGGFRKINFSSIPLLGGLAVAVPFIAYLLVSVSTGSNNLGITSQQTIAWIIGCVLLVFVGIYDDIFGMKARGKFLWQIFVAVFTVIICLRHGFMQQIYLPFFGLIKLNFSIAFLIGVAWIVGLINAFNLIDGIDGLASGIALIVILTLAVHGKIGGDLFLISSAMVLGGSLLAFLIFNFNPAKIFLGDTGSMFLGYVIAVLTLLCSYRYNTAIIVFSPLIALGFPLFEAMISMGRRYLRGVPIFVGDNAHTHHRLLDLGYSQKKVVLILYGVSVLLAMWSILDRIIPSYWRWIPIVLFILTLIGIAWLAGYLRMQNFYPIIKRRRHNKRLKIFAKYITLAISNKENKAEDGQVIAAICCYELQLQFLKVEIQHENKKEIVLESGTYSQKDPLKRFTIQSVYSDPVEVQYQFNKAIDELEEHDISICLANILSHL